MEVVKILLEAGASPNKTNAYGQVHLLSFLLASVVNQIFMSPLKLIKDTGFFIVPVYICTGMNQIALRLSGYFNFFFF